MTFGEFFRIVRVDRKISIIKLADKIGVTVNVLVDLENDDVDEIDTTIVEQIIEGLYLTPTEIKTLNTLSIKSRTNALEPTAPKPSKFKRKVALRVAKDIDATDEEWADLMRKYNNMTY